MQFLIKVILVATLAYCVSAAHRLFQQGQLPAQSNEDIVGVGCFCIKSNETLTVGSIQRNLLDCFCTNNFEDLPENNNTAGDFNRLINPFADIAEQAALVCTCAYPRSVNATSSNAAFLFLDINSTGQVPVNCTCARAIDYLPTIIPPEVTIPILNITIPIPFSNPNKTFENLVPLGCFCSSRADLLSGVSVMGYSLDLPALFCKCLPPINASSGQLAVLGSDWFLPSTSVNIPSLNLTLGGFDASSLLSNFSLGSLPAGITFSNTSFTIPFLGITVTPPPFINVGQSEQQP